MAKQSGLGDYLFAGGYDISGDVGSVQGLRMPSNLLPDTGLDKSAFERMYGLIDGGLAFNNYFNDALLAEHVALKVPRKALGLAYFKGGAIGNQAFALLAKQLNYDYNRGADGSLIGSVDSQLDAGYPPEWCEQLTAGKRTDTAAANGSGLNGGSQATAVNISSVGVANPGQVNATAHGLVTGDSVVIAGTTTTPSINNRYTVTVVNANQFTIPVNVTSGQAGAAGTVTKTSTNFGLSAYIQNFAFAGTDVTWKLQDSADDSTYADITAGAFTQITAGATDQRIETGLTAIIREYVRAVSVTSAGFTSSTVAICFKRYTAAGRNL